MQKTILSSISIIAFILLLFSCDKQNKTSTNKYSSPQTLADTSATQTALNYFEWRYTDFERLERPLFSDHDFWFKNHKEEVQETLEVADVLKANNLAIALLRFSVGSDIYREAIWLRKYDGLWTVSSNQYFSTYGDDPFGDGQPDRAERIIEKEEEWTENSAEKF